MKLNSAELAQRLHDQGLLSKEAMSHVLHVRQRLYKTAMKKQSGPVLDWILNAGRSAKQGLQNIADRFSRPGMAKADFPRHPPGTVRWDADQQVFRDIGNTKIQGVGYDPITEKPVSAELPREGIRWTDLAANIAKLSLLGSAIGAAQSGVAGAIGRISEHREEANLKKELADSYQQMFSELPRLQNLPPEKVERAFDVMARYAPSLAKDPTVAGAFVDRSYQTVIDADTVKRLAEAEKAVSEGSRGRDLFEGFDSGLSLARMAMGRDD